ncbi:MAG: hypothetical protein C0624_09760 [Desulfuromonas sp.]|nr:MAG: hypothetical protein C0624_09760 [Desulfuromonas sp.]
MNNPRLRFILIAILLITTPVLTEAADWRIKPIRIDLNARAKNGAVTVINSSDHSITFQVNATLWTQDASSKDLFSPTEDLIFFPHILTVEPHKERIIRAGVKVPATDTEKTYRLFVEEIPSAQDASGTKINVKVRFGIPVFVTPLEPQRSMEASKLSLNNGLLSATLLNTGNSHTRPVSLSAVGLASDGQEVFRYKKDGWYLLTGAQRTYTIPIDANDCRKAAEIQLEVDGQYLDILEKLPAGSYSCHDGS